MGIRFDRDARRATNGPLIFFTLVKDEAFEEEIQSAFLSNLSFYAYRFPNDTFLSYGSSEGFLESIGIPGFVVGMFSPSLPYLTIPYKGIKKTEVYGLRYEMPSKSTTFSEYSDEIDRLVRKLKQRDGEKVVISRVLVREEKIDIADLFYEFCHRFPDAYVFCFSTPATGCWIGASPELLLEGDPSGFHSMALAGTRPVASESEWDLKNIEEQRIVTDYICDIFQRNGLEPKLGETFSKSAGNIEHICTPVSAEYRRDSKITDDRFQKLLRDLSPTPALCGSPKDFALEQIDLLEKFDRGCYGGFCGPFHNWNDFNFNVILRCAAVNERRLCIYAGGGITAKSEISVEWEETESKIKSIFPRIYS